MPYEEKRLSMRFRILVATAILLSVFLVTQSQVDGSVEPQRLGSTSYTVPSPLPTTAQGPEPQEAPTRPPPLRPRSPRTGECGYTPSAMESHGSPLVWNPRRYRFGGALTDAPSS